MSAIEILIQPPASELVRGETVSVPITLNLEKPVNVRGIHAKFLGAEESKATYSQYNAATKSTQVHTAVEHIEIVKQEFLLSGQERLGFFGNIADGLTSMFGGGQHERLQPGKYDFEIQLDVPKDASGTFEAKKCRVFYEVSVRVDIPLGFDAKATSSFALPMIYDVATSVPVMTRYPEDQDRGLFDSWFGPEMRVEAGVAGSHYRRGEEIEGIFRVESPKPLECRAISVRLVGIEKTQAQGHQDSHHHQGPETLVAQPGAIDGTFEQDFRIPTDFDGPTSATGQRFSVNWYVQIQLDVPWAKDPKIRVPINLID